MCSPGTACILLHWPEWRKGTWVYVLSMPCVALCINYTSLTCWPCAFQIKFQPKLSFLRKWPPALYFWPEHCFTQLKFSSIRHMNIKRWKLLCNIFDKILFTAGLSPIDEFPWIQFWRRKAFAYTNITKVVVYLKNDTEDNIIFILHWRFEAWN